MSGESPVVCVVVRTCVYVSVCISVLFCSGGYPAVCGGVSVHLPRHRSDIFSVTGTLTAVLSVDGVRRAAECVPELVAVCVALSVTERLTGCVIERGVSMRVCRRWAACVSMCVAIIVAFPV